MTDPELSDEQRAQVRAIFDPRPEPAPDETTPPNPVVASEGNIQQIAAAHGLSDADRDLFLANSDDPELLAAQLAKRFAAPDRRLVVRQEGRHVPRAVDPNAELREFVAELFTTPYPYN